MNKARVFGGGALVIGAVALVWWQNAPENRPSNVVASINVPALGDAATAGEQNFNQFCSACHGQNAAGTAQGPPLIHRTYAPGHHGDEAIQVAVKIGVRAHHWRFGSMPAVNGISDDQIDQVIAYIREVQAANGIN